MIVDNILSDAEERMEKALGVLKNNLAGIRTGRAAAGATGAGVTTGAGCGA